MSFDLIVRPLSDLNVIDRMDLSFYLGAECKLLLVLLSLFFQELIPLNCVLPEHSLLYIAGDRERHAKPGRDWHKLRFNSRLRALNTVCDNF